MLDSVKNLLLSYSGKQNVLYSWLKLNYPDIYNDIIKNAEFYQVKLIKSPVPFLIKCAWYVHEIHDYPICPICGKINYRFTSSHTLKELLTNKNFLLYDSKKCVEIGENVKEKQIQNTIQKYGSIENRNLIAKEKYKKSMLEKYGVDNPSKSESIKEKKKQTYIQRYGTECSFQAKEVKDKIKETLIERYGVDNISKKKEFQDKKIETNIKKYGETSYNKTQEFKDRFKHTCLEKYGVENPLQLEYTKQRAKEVCLEKYGVEYYLQSNEIQEKIKRSCLEKYGAEYAFQSDEFKKIQTEKNLEKYGVMWRTQIPEFQKYATECNLKKYYDGLKNNEYVIPLFDFEYYKENYSKELKWKCKRCGNEFIGKKDNNWHGVARCEKCYPYECGLSVGETEVRNFISSIIDYEIVYKNRSILNNLELDIYIPSKNLAIEYDGIYWHSDRFINDPSYHLQKTQFCESKGIQLIHIFEDEWENKKDIVKDRIKSILGIYDIKIGARQCEIRSVSDNESKQFLINNHIQGYVPSSINLALFYNNELISLMTFGPYRKSLGSEKKENEYEMYRFCNKLGYHISGGASKLLKKFEELVKPKKLISYCDRRWSQGKLYKSIGFQLVKETQPNYWYVINEKRENRFKYRKSQLPKLLEVFDPLLSEEENMKNNDFYKIYDCGNYLFSKIY